MDKKVIKIVCSKCGKLYEVNPKESLELRNRLCPDCKRRFQ